MYKTNTKKLCDKKINYLLHCLKYLNLNKKQICQCFGGKDINKKKSKNKLQTSQLYEAYICNNAKVEALLLSLILNINNLKSVDYEY